MSKISPNSFQCPNLYSDKLMPFLTGEEWKVLTYSVRRIMGFLKRQDHISLSQFESGIQSSDGETLDYGTGLCRATICRAIGKLVEFGILIRLDDTARRGGSIYALELDESKIKFDALQARTSSPRQLVHPVNQSTASTSSSSPHQPELVHPVNTQKPVAKASKQKPVKPPASQVQPLDGALPKKKSAPQKKDPNLDHPAVQIFRDVMHITPNDLQRAEIAEQVGNVEIWRQTLTRRKMRGWNPKDVAKALENYTQALVNPHWDSNQYQQANQTWDHVNDPRGLKRLAL